MLAFVLALLVASIGARGGRTERLVHRIAWRLGRPRPLLALAWIAATGAAAIAVLGGRFAGSWLPASGAGVACSFTFALAAIQWMRGRGPTPALAEPTRSAPAILAVLLVGQLTDGPRIAVLALAMAGLDPLRLVLGSAVGGGMALTLAWARRTPEVGNRPAA